MAARRSHARLTMRAANKAVPHLIEWYRLNHRPMPWRDATHDPYAVWVSEIMLQQTQVATALPYYQHWLERFPTLQTLAEASEETVLAAWSGLGYYSRARNLHKAAQHVWVTLKGAFPASSTEWRKLPGIGEYTSAAIASICFGEASPVIDGNVERVVSRLLALTASPKSVEGRTAIRALLKELIPTQSPGLFNQAMMELGARICTPRSPSCPACPLSEICAARQSGTAHEFPVRPPTPKPIPQVHCSLAVHYKGRVLMQRVPEGQLWAGLWQFPRTVSFDEEAPLRAMNRLSSELGLPPAPAQQLLPIKHTATRFAITLIGFLAHLSELPYPTPQGDFTWVPIGRAALLPLPAPQRKLLLQVQAQLNSNEAMAA